MRTSQAVVLYTCPTNEVPLLSQDPRIPDVASVFCMALHTHTIWLPSLSPFPRDFCAFLIVRSIDEWEECSVCVIWKEIEHLGLVSFHGC